MLMLLLTTTPQDRCGVVERIIAPHVLDEGVRKQPMIRFTVMFDEADKWCVHTCTDEGAFEVSMLGLTSK